MTVEPGKTLETEAVLVQPAAFRTLSVCHSGRGPSPVWGFFGVRRGRGRMTSTSDRRHRGPRPRGHNDVCSRRPTGAGDASVTDSGTGSSSATVSTDTPSWRPGGHGPPGPGGSDPCRAGPLSGARGRTGGDPGPPTVQHPLSDRPDPSLLSTLVCPYLQGFGKRPRKVRGRTL